MSTQTVCDLLAHFSVIDVLALNSYSNDPVIANYKAYGFSGIVTKPYRVEQLRNVLNSLLA